MRRLLLLVILALLVLPGGARAETVTFPFVGVAQSWTVPAGTTKATFELYGAAGGDNPQNSTAGGKGARVRATIDVTPGEQLVIFVGGQGAVRTGGFNGGGKGQNGSSATTDANAGRGGGGATDVRRGGTGFANRVMVAAGGGGASRAAAGGNSAADGGGSPAGAGGRAGQADQGGAAGGCNGCGSPNVGNPGAFGVGADGKYTASTVAGGGGGAGWWGGGSGRGENTGGDGGGGGGSNLVGPAGAIVSGALVENGARAGDGQASVTFTPTGSGQGTAPPADTTKPALTRLSLSRSAFAAASSGASTSAKGKRKKKPPVGTKVAYSLSEAGSVRFTVERKASGRKVGKKCVTPKRSNRGKKKCTLWKKVRGAFSVTGKAGRNSFTFRGRVGGRKLSTGRYRLTGVATDRAKNASKSVQKSFRIVK